MFGIEILGKGGCIKLVLFSYPCIALTLQQRGVLAHGEVTEHSEIEDVYDNPQ